MTDRVRVITQLVRGFEGAGVVTAGFTEATAISMMPITTEIGFHTIPHTGTTLRGAAGAQGSTGAQGSEGAQGAMGVTGSTGSTGAQGVVGPQGQQGETGAQGLIGAQGVQGQQGNQGQQGETGAQGNTGADSTVAGPQGQQGDIGPQGATGPTGADSTVQGPQGPQGETGAQGAPGAGSMGMQGHQGHQGADGAQGAQGAQGQQGETGAQGQQGESGAQGQQGETGAQGPGGSGLLDMDKPDGMPVMNNDVLTVDINGMQFYLNAELFAATPVVLDDPTTQRINIGASVPTTLSYTGLQARGGVPPYTYTTDQGTLTPTSGGASTPVSLSIPTGPLNINTSTLGTTLAATVTATDASNRSDGDESDTAMARYEIFDNRSVSLAAPASQSVFNLQTGNLTFTLSGSNMDFSQTQISVGSVVVTASGFSQTFTPTFTRSSNNITFDIPASTFIPNRTYTVTTSVTDARFTAPRTFSNVRATYTSTDPRRYTGLLSTPTTRSILAQTAQTYDMATSSIDFSNSDVATTIQVGSTTITPTINSNGMFDVPAASYNSNGGVTVTASISDTRISGDTFTGSHNRTVTVVTPYFWGQPATQPTAVPFGTEVLQNFAIGQEINIPGSSEQFLIAVVSASPNFALMNNVTTNVIDVTLLTTITATTANGTDTITYNLYTAGAINNGQTYTVVAA